MAEQKATKQKIAIVLVRGMINTMPRTRDTLGMLNLYRKNYCTVYEKTPSILGMIGRAKDMVTWGEITEETYKKLVEKRGEKDPKDVTKLKKYFRLNPPKKGFGRKGIKRAFSAGGGLGYRGEKMNDLIERML